ncbi:MAG: hypothetical protein GWP10_02825, partial [Nitrospiraceae bacterium]|nr:hypothetical protein [Nitrospiraceae bacterium]
MKKEVVSESSLPLDLLWEKGNTSVVPIRWEGHKLYLLDQRLLPHEEVWCEYSSSRGVARAIRDMVVRGAPAIGITAAFGMVLAAYGFVDRDRASFIEKWLGEADFMLQARPTAINLKWAVERLRRQIDRRPELSTGDLAASLEKEAISIWSEDIQANLDMGSYGQAL